MLLPLNRQMLGRGTTVTTPEERKIQVVLRPWPLTMQGPVCELWRSLGLGGALWARQVPHRVGSLLLHLPRWGWAAGRAAQ